MKKALVGTARNPHDGKWYPVVAWEFADTPGYYQFNALTSHDHWRAFAAPSKFLAEIPYRIMGQLRDECLATTVEPWRRAK